MKLTRDMRHLFKSLNNDQKKPDCVLFYNYDFHNLHLTGVPINNLEYFFTIFEYNPDFKFIMLNAHESVKQDLIKVAENRYYLDDLKGYQDNIICMKMADLLKFRLGRVLVTDILTLLKTKDVLRFFWMHYLVEEDYDFPYRYVTKYAEMPFHKGKRYRMKMLFNRFRMLNSVDKGIYINSPKNFDFSFLKYLDLPDKPIVYKSRSHLENMFEKFDTYLYWHANRWFDPSPRMFAECYFYNKKILYYNHDNIKDGSWYRYNDLMENGLSGRILGKNDELVQEFI